MPDDFPKDLRVARRSKGETQTDAANAIGVTTSTWARWETGESSPSVKSIPALAEYLGITPEELVKILIDE